MLFSTTTVVIGQDESAWQKPVSGSDSSVKENYGPAPVNAPPSDPIVVTIPKTATAAATAYSAAIVQSAGAGPIQFPEETTAVKTVN